MNTLTVKDQVIKCQAVIHLQLNNFIILFSTIIHFCQLKSSIWVPLIIFYNTEKSDETVFDGKSYTKIIPNKGFVPKSIQFLLENKTTFGNI